MSRKSVLYIFIVLVILTACIVSSSGSSFARFFPSFGISRSASKTLYDEVDWKLLFNQLFAIEILKELPIGDSFAEREYYKKRYDEILKTHTYYTPKTFNEAINEVLKAENSNEAYNIRKKIFASEHNRKLIKRADLLSALSRRAKSYPAIRDYIKTILRYKNRRIKSKDEHILDTPEGKNMLNALTFRGENKKRKGVVFLLLPGYASHTIKDYIFEDFVFDFNTYYGRSKRRPIVFEDGLDIEFEPHDKYYSSGNNREKLLDVLHPSGKELGNTAGSNLETVDILKDWISNLPPEYDNKDIVLLGYSKGAPSILDLVRRHPDLKDRIIGYVTYGGVIQGTNVARSILSNSSEILRSRNVSEFVDKFIEDDPHNLLSSILPIIGDANLLIFKIPAIIKVLSLFNVDVADLEDQADKFLKRREISEILLGAEDLSPLKRTKWNLKYFNNSVFERDVFLFNLSALADVKTFSRPEGIREDGSKAPSLISPTFNTDGKIDWETFSLDALFLYITSLGGFQTAPGGLFDTQVELPHTKSFLLDTRPLKESLTDKELDYLWGDPDLKGIFLKNGINSKEALSETPRKDLISRDNTSNINSIDLGEIKGHHWSLFVQALKPPKKISTKHAVWSFPKKAYMRALMQVMALYNLVNVVEKTERGGR